MEKLNFTRSNTFKLILANLEIGFINNPNFLKITSGQRQKNSLLYHFKIGQNYYVYKYLQLSDYQTGFYLPTAESDFSISCQNQFENIRSREIELSSAEHEKVGTKKLILT